MRRKLVALLAAFVLATFGTVVLAAYVQSAKNRAEASEATVEILVVTKALTKGSPATAQVLKRERIPVRLKAPDAVQNLDDLKGLVTQADLLPGDQLLRGRFASPADVTRGLAPSDKLQVTIALGAEQAVGGNIKPGDTVAVVASFKPFEIDKTAAGVPADAPSKTPNMTHIFLHKVLVTAVQTDKVQKAAPAPAQPDAKPGETTTTTAPSVAPSGELLITLALDAHSVERVVFAAENGSIWLSTEPPAAPEGGTEIVTIGDFF